MSIKFRKLFSLVLVICVIMSVFPKVNAATKLVITSPTQKQEIVSNQAVTIRWKKPSGSISYYIVNVRELSVGNGTTGNLIVNRVQLSSSATSYSLPWSILTYDATYRISVSAYFSDGTSPLWSDEIYFFTTCYKLYTQHPISFYIWEGFSDLTKDAIYYSAQAWNNALEYNVELVNTYPLSQCHSLQVINNYDGLNYITAATPPVGQSYLMSTYIRKNSSGTAIEIDINVNRSGHPWANSAQPGKYDVQSSMTHEMGHVVGLAHTYESFAIDWTMYGYTNMNDIRQRSLHSNDITLLRSLYTVS